jgi:hypothetical protein
MGKTSVIDARAEYSLAQRMDSKGTVLLDEALVAHVLERSLLRDDKSDLSKLSRKQQA